MDTTFEVELARLKVEKKQYQEKKFQHEEEYDKWDRKLESYCHLHASEIPKGYSVRQMARMEGKKELALELAYMEKKRALALSKMEEASDQADKIGNKLKKLRLQQKLESKREERDKRWLEERVEEVDRELEDCYDKTQTHAYEIERIKTVLEPLEFNINKKEEKKSKSLLAEALKEGFVRVLIIVCALLGLPGVGKTHLKLLLLEKPPPHLRSSTNCAEAPIRIEIRTISGMRVKTVEGKWKEVDDEDMLDVVANMIVSEEDKLSHESVMAEGVRSAEKVSSKRPKRGVLNRIFEWIKKSGQTLVGKATTDTPRPQVISDSCRKATKKIMDSLVQRITRIRDERETGAQSPTRKSIITAKWIYLTDSGGQPQYHELLPLFVRHISTALCVLRLPDKLDELQPVEYYYEGKRVGPSHLSQLTAKDTIKSLVNTIQSYSPTDRPPKILVVGTHVDKLEESLEQPLIASCQDVTTSGSERNVSECIAEKDKSLLGLLEPEFSDQLVYYSSDMKKLLIPLNTLNPGERDKTNAQSIRQAIENSGAREVEVPIWWYILELLLQELAKELGRGVLSRAECLQVAYLLDIREDSFDAALKFFNELNVIKYSSEVLPNVVFIDSQIPLDKISELVRHSFWLRQPAAEEEPSPVDGEWKRFRDQGVVTSECLKNFNRHYVSDIFSIDDLSELLKHLLVFAPIPTPSWVPTDNTTPTTAVIYFVMPALLLTLSEEELERRRVSSPAIATLLVRFPHGSRCAGVFCCFVVHLIRHCGWDLLLNAKEPLHRNCIKLHLRSSPPCTVVLIDSNSFIEIYVKITAEASVSEGTQLLSTIKQSIFGGISAACRVLNYKQTRPEIAFFCPHSHSLPSSQASKLPQRHTVTLTDDKKYWCCDVDPNVSGRLESHHLIWFGISQGAKVVSTDHESSTTGESNASSYHLFEALEQHYLAASPGRPSADKSTSLTEKSPHLPNIVEYVSISSGESNISDMSKPSSANLTVITWKNDHGEIKKFRLKSSIIHKWRDIGDLVVPWQQLAVWAKRKDDKECCEAVLSHWLDHPPRHYPATWEGLYELLNDSELGQVATELKQAVDHAL